MCHFDNLITLISLDNDCMLHLISDVIYRKPCFIHIKSVRKVISITFSEISLVSSSVAPAPSQKFTCYPLRKAVSLHCATLSFYCPPPDNYWINISIWATAHLPLP